MKTRSTRTRCPTRATTRVAPIGANLPNGVLIGTSSRWLAEVAVNVFGGGVQRLHVWLRGNRVDDRRDDQTQEAPNAVFYAAARRGESPRWSAMSGSVNSVSKRFAQNVRFCAPRILA